MRQVKIKIASTLLCAALAVKGLSQTLDQQSVDNRTISNAAGFLLISPDARGSAMGDGGVATSADNNSMFWNPAKYAFANSDAGVGISFTPWLVKLTNDVNIGYVSGYKKLDGQQTLAASFRYFSYGYIPFTTPDGVGYGGTKPAELSFDLAYIRRLTQNFSLALAGRYIHSDIGRSVDPNGGLQATSAGAVDVALYYTKESKIGSLPADISYGVNISNIGSKLNGGTQKSEFLPTNLRVGGGSNFHLDESNFLSVNLDINKLLVPTPPYRDLNQNPVKGKDPNVSVPSGIFQSFYDAPGGAKEKLQELSYSLGVEYSYNKNFFLRSGYFYENPNKGNRRYATIGAGVKFKAINIDLAYLLSAKPSPLDNTLRFSLNFNFGGKLSGSDAEN